MACRLSTEGRFSGLLDSIFNAGTGAAGFAVRFCTMVTATHRARCKYLVMKFTRDPVSPVAIRQVQRGAIQVGTEEYSGDFLITADGEVRACELPVAGELNEIHLEPLLEGDPELIVVGTGWTATFLRRELVFAMARLGIGLETMDTPAACRTFNILVGEGRRPAAMIKSG